MGAKMDGVVSDGDFNVSEVLTHQGKKHKTAVTQGNQSWVKKEEESDSKYGHPAPKRRKHKVTRGKNIETVRGLTSSPVRPIERRRVPPGVNAMDKALPRKELIDPSNPIRLLSSSPVRTSGRRRVLPGANAMDKAPPTKMVIDPSSIMFILEINVMGTNVTTPVTMDMLVKDTIAVAVAESVLNRLDLASFTSLAEMGKFGGMRNGMRCVTR